MKVKYKGKMINVSVDKILTVYKMYGLTDKELWELTKNKEWAKLRKIRKEMYQKGYEGSGIPQCPLCEGKTSVEGKICMDCEDEFYIDKFGFDAWMNEMKRLWGTTERLRYIE